MDLNQCCWVPYTCGDLWSTLQCNKRISELNGTQPCFARAFSLCYAGFATLEFSKLRLASMPVLRKRLTQCLATHSIIC